MNITMLIVIAVLSIVMLFILSFYELYGSEDDKQKDKKEDDERKGKE